MAPVPFHVNARIAPFEHRQKIARLMTFMPYLTHIDCCLGAAQAAGRAHLDSNLYPLDAIIFNAIESICPPADSSRVSNYVQLLKFHWGTLAPGGMS